MTESAKAFPTYQIDESLAEKRFDSFFQIKAEFLQKPAGRMVKNAQFLLHPVFFPVGKQFIPVGISGDLIDGDRQWTIVESTSFQI